MVLRKLEIHMQKKNKNLDPYFIPYTKINSNVKTYMIDSELSNS